MYTMTYHNTVTSLWLGVGDIPQYSGHCGIFADDMILQYDLQIPVFVRLYETYLKQCDLNISSILLQSLQSNLFTSLSIWFIIT